MKTNHIPVQVRLKNRIAKLYAALGDETEPIGKPNPYHRCSGCKRSIPDISINGHFKGCRVVGIKKEIAYYKALMANSDQTIT